MASMEIQALTFDTGGTILDWHTGFRDALAAAGAKCGYNEDWAELANELRRRSLKAMLNHGEHGPVEYNIDQAHRFTLEKILQEKGLDRFTEEDLTAVAYTAPHRFTCWPDFPGTLPRLRSRFIVASFTILSYRLIIDTAKANGLSWDVVLSCEGIGKYKLLPEAYQTAAAYLQLEPAQCCMVACHDFDLNAARAVGFKTALVRRPNEWGANGPVPPEPNPDNDYIVDSFPDLARALGIDT